MTNEPERCPKCGAVILIEGRCSRCMMEMGLTCGKARFDEMVGKTLGTYEIFEELGRGGMGVVYKAHDSSLDRTAALKVLAPRLCEDAEFIERFRQEAQSAARLAHPTIVPIYAFGDEDGCYFFAMEYVQGVDLAAYLKKHQKLETSQALNLAARLASALEAAHAEGVIHRDIKPQNIMIDHAGRVRILDFGLAKLLGPETAITTNKAFIGTPAYVSPEQCENKELDGRSDLYSLGVTLYECLAGRLPYQSKTPVGLVKKILFSDPDPIREAAPEIAPELENLVHCLLAKDPDKRFQSATELLKRIDEIQEGSSLGGGEADGSRSTKAVLSSALIGLTELTSRLGKVPESEVVGKYEALFHDCLGRFGGLEERPESRRQEPDARIKKEAGRWLASFDKSLDAIRCAMAFQQDAGKLELPENTREFAPRLHVGISMGASDRFADLRPDAEEDDPVARILATAERVMELAAPRQTLVTHEAFDSARRETLDAPGDSRIVWLAHGPYLFEGSEESIEIAEVGLSGFSPLAAPPDSDKARSATRVGDEVTLGWRPATGLEIPSRKNWRLERNLGEGGFGEVWMARHLKSNDRRIFKFCFEANRLRGLKREVALFRLLKETLGGRDDICRLLDWNLETAPFFIESEYTEGGNLEEWVQEQGGIDAVPLSTRLELIAQAATALAAAHSVGVIHKDIKPANILIGKDVEGQPRAVLADFGIGVITDTGLLEEKGITIITELAASKASSSRTGTRLYMAPELIAGRPPSIQSDVYALGVMLYQILVGRLHDPLGQGWERDIEDELLREDLVRCVDGDSERRLANATELAKRLRNLEQRRAELAARQATERTIVRRRRFAAMLTAAATFLLLLGFALGYGLYREQKAHRQTLEEKKNTKEAWQEEARQRKAAEYEQYVATIMLAGVSIKERRLHIAQQTLLAAPVHLRNWEWGYLMRRAHPELLTLIGHSGGVQDALFSPDGARIVTASRDGTAKVWDAATGRQLVSLEGRRGYVWSVVFSPDSTLIVISSSDSELIGGTGLSSDSGLIPGLPPSPGFMPGSVEDTVKVWDAVTGIEIASLKGRGSIYPPVFSPDGTRVVTTDPRQGIVWIWDAATGQVLDTFQGHPGGAWSAQFSPDGTRLLTASFGQAHFSPDGTRVVTANLKNTEFHSSGVRVLSGRPGREEGSAIIWEIASKRKLVKIVGPYSRGTAKIWDVATGRELVALKGHTAGLWDIQFCFDGTRIVTASEDTVKIWDVTSGREIATLKGFSDIEERSAWTPRAQFSHDGLRIATASVDGTAKIWDAATGRELATFRSQASPTGERPCLRFSPDGTRIVTAFGNQTAKVWDAVTDRDADVLRKGASIARFTADNERIMTSNYDGFARIWDVATGRELFKLENRPAGRGPSAQFSPDGTRIVVAFEDGGTANIWNTATGRIHATLEGRTYYISNVQFSPDGQRILTTSGKTAKVWDAATGRKLTRLVGHTDKISSAQFSPNGIRIVTSSIDSDTAKVWDAATGRELATLEGEPSWGGYRGAQFSPDGARILAVEWQSFKRGIAIVWDATTGREIITLDPTLARVGKAIFSPDGRYILTHMGNIVLLWEAATGREFATLMGHTSWVARAQFSPDGTRIVTGSDDCSAKIWDAATGRELVTLEGHFRRIPSVEFSPDGKLIVTAAGEVRIWRTFPWKAEDYPGTASDSWAERFRLFQAKRYQQQREAATATLR